MTNEQGRTLRLPLGSLGRGRYELTEYADGPGAATEPKQVAASARRVRAGEILTLRLAPSGGYAARISPVR